MKKLAALVLLGLLAIGGLLSNSTFIAEPDHPKITSITFNKL
jgi:hypothetical protein